MDTPTFSRKEGGGECLTALLPSNAFQASVWVHNDLSTHSGLKSMIPPGLRLCGNVQAIKFVKSAERQCRGGCVEDIDQRLARPPRRSVLPLWMPWMLFYKRGTEQTQCTHPVIVIHTAFLAAIQLNRNHYEIFNAISIRSAARDARTRRLYRADGSAGKHRQHRIYRPAGCNRKSGQHRLYRRDGRYRKSG